MATVLLAATAQVAVLVLKQAAKAVSADLVPNALVRNKIVRNAPVRDALRRAVVAAI